MWWMLGSGPLLGRLGVKAAGAAAARVAAELDAASVVARMEAAVKSRRVTVRPAPDGMAYLSVLGPLKDVVGAYAAVQARSRAVVSGQCPEEGRRVGGWVRSRRTPRCGCCPGGRRVSSSRWRCTW